MLLLHYVTWWWFAAALNGQVHDSYGNSGRLWRNYEIGEGNVIWGHSVVARNLGQYFPQIYTLRSTATLTLKGYSD